MDIHAILNDLAVQVVILEPQESQVVSVFRVYVETMEHLLNVACHCYFFFPKSLEYTNESIHHVWSLQEEFIERLIVEDSTAIEDYPNLVRFLWMVDVKMRKKPDFACFGLKFL